MRLGKLRFESKYQAIKYFYEKNEDRYEIITLNKSFHGRTITTATATGQEKYKKPSQ